MSTTEPARPIKPSSLTAWLGPVWPGLLLVAGLAAVARAVTAALPDVISEVTVGVVLGLAVTNILTLPAILKPGIKFAVGTLLRVGIVLLGARLSFGDVLANGLGALAIILVGMSVALLFTLAVGRLFALPPRLCLLIGVGTAVCGNSAIVATAPVVEAEERDVSFAVATITLFGTLAVLLYPVIGQLAGFSDRFFGYWAGVAVNDTSQVVATGFAYSDPAGEIATVVKLTRNTLMGPLIVLIGLVYARAAARQRPTASRLSFFKIVPLFVLGFLAMALLNTAGLIPDVAAEAFDEAARALILLALVGVGLSTDLSQMRRVGLRPLYLGLAASVLLSLLALAMITLVL